MYLEALFVRKKAVKSFAATIFHIMTVMQVPGVKELNKKD